MKSTIALGILCSIAVLDIGCSSDVDAESSPIGQSKQAFSKSAYFWDGPTLFKSIPLSQNCTLTVETTDGTVQRDPILALIINNSLGWGSSTVPCNHGTRTATDGFTTLAFNNNISGGNYNARVSYMNPNGGSPLTVFAVGFLDATVQGGSTYFGNLHVKYSITGCSDPSKNKPSTTFLQDFHASGIQGSFPGYAYTWEPRPGGPQCATDTVLFGINPGAYGYGQCNDNCPAPLGTPTLSCISNNTGSSLWWMSPGWFWNGPGSGFTSVNNP